MMNDRPIQNPKLARALAEVRRVLEKHDMAGAVFIVAKDEAAWTYKMHATWSMIIPDQSPGGLGFRFRVNSTEMGRDRAHAMAEAGVHTVCQISDFGEQTVGWMEQLKLMLRKAGMDFDHRPFNGNPLPGLSHLPPGEQHGRG